MDEHFSSIRFEQTPDDTENESECTRGAVAEWGVTGWPN